MAKDGVGDSLIEEFAPLKQHSPAVASVEAAEEWITWPEAAEIVGCPVPTIEHYAREGHITKRPRRGARPSLLRSSVKKFATRWREITTARETAREAARQEPCGLLDEGLPAGRPERVRWRRPRASGP